MAIKLLFEDGVDTPSSQLLKRSHYGNEIYFSGGSSNVLNKACEIKGINDIVYIYYDVSPNYNKTVKGYQELVRKIKSDKITYSNIYVIPIICIEYYICRMFDRYNYIGNTDEKTISMVNNLVRKFDWNALPDVVKNNRYVSESLEHAYKNIMTSLKPRCLHNQISNKDNIPGKFYTSDCICRKYCNVEKEDSVILKAERLYTLLPLFVVVSDSHKNFLSRNGLSIITKTNTDVQRALQSFYNSICKNMNVATIRINI